MSSHNPGLCKLKTIRDSLETVLDNIDKNCNKIELDGASTGFIDLDVMGLMQPAELIVIAGRPAIGKTAFISNIIEHHALTNKKSIAIFTTELTEDNFISRLICSIENINPLRLKTKDLKDFEWKKIARAVVKLQESKVYICDKLRITPNEIRESISCIKAPIDLIIVDYFQYVYANENKYSIKTEEYTEIAYALKLVAKELNIPIIIVSQMSKDVDSREDYLPKLSDLREYGELESIADKILFIHRDSYYDIKQQDDDRAQIIMARNKSGYIGSAALIFNKDIMRFKNIMPRPKKKNKVLN